MMVIIIIIVVVVVLSNAWHEQYQVFVVLEQT